MARDFYHNDFRKALEKEGWVITHDPYVMNVDQMWEPERVLYLAIPESMYNSFFQKTVIQKSIERIGAKIVVYNPQTQIIVRWID